MQLRRPANLATGTFFAFTFGLVFPLFLTVPTQAQDDCKKLQDVCSQDWLDKKLPVPPLNGSKRVVQLVNCSCETLLGATNAAHKAFDKTTGKVPLGYPVFPREGTWVIPPYGTVDKNGVPTNYLTIDVPPEWFNTKCGSNTPKNMCPALGPNMWARTGCRYDIATNRAQCETGTCADQYDCSSAAQSQVGYTSIAEWTFYQGPVPGFPPNQSQQFYIDNFDISLVNGANLNLDIEGKNGANAPCLAGTPFAGQSICDPTAPYDQKWLAYNYPLSVHGNDLRANDPTTNQNCTDANGNSFVIKRSDIHKHGNGIFDYVIVDQNGNPTMPAGDNPLACFSNCGKYEFERAATPGGQTCEEANNDPNCTYAWKVYCAGDSNLYPATCTTDKDCATQAGTDVHASCYYNDPTNPNQKTGFCALRAFYQTPSTACPLSQLNGPHDPGSPANAVACTFNYGSLNPADPGATTQIDYSDQPPADPCSIVTSDGPVPCVGDDTIHQVFHGAYTWPNDPETLDSDSPVYRIIFAPGGTTVAVTAAQSVPLCSDLPPNYNYTQNYQKGVNSSCITDVDGEGAVYAIANENGVPWSCALDPKGAGSTGVICRWHPAPTGTPNGCSPPLTDQFVTNSACGLIASGISLVSSSITPSNNDWLFAEVAIATQNPTTPVNPPSISGCVDSWSPVNGGSISFGSQTNAKQGLVTWYSGQVTTGAKCQVTATLAESNPATLKVYDVPSYNGMVETTSSASGVYNFTQPLGEFPWVSAQANPVTTKYPLDLMLGSLLQVNQQLTPATYWANWLSDGLTFPYPIDCVNDNFCPIDDGTDYMPGHGPYSSNADAGHEVVEPGKHALQRSTHATAKFNWGGTAIYLELKATPLSVACASSSAQVGVAYSSPMVARGGVPQYTYGINGGALPPGLMLGIPAEGYIYGTPTTAGTYPYGAQATDKNGTQVINNCSITVAPGT